MIFEFGLVLHLATVLNSGQHLFSHKNELENLGVDNLCAFKYNRIYGLGQRDLDQNSSIDFDFLLY